MEALAARWTAHPWISSSFLYFIFAYYGDIDCYHSTLINKSIIREVELKMGLLTLHYFFKKHFSLYCWHKNLKKLKFPISLLRTTVLQNYITTKKRKRKQAGTYGPVSICDKHFPFYLPFPVQSCSRVLPTRRTPTILGLSRDCNGYHNVNFTQLKACQYVLTMKLYFLNIC